MEHCYMADNPSSPVAQNCLRCSDIELIRLPGSTNSITFFECPACHRQYAQKPEGALVYRWLHPVSLPLYAVLFEAEPLSQAQAVAEGFVRSYSRDQLTIMIDEIELELQHPTQNVRDILDSLASEEKCREFLKACVAHIRSAL
jgi:hypothetical protein